MRSERRIAIGAFVLGLTVTITPAARAQTAGGRADAETGSVLAKKLVNPLANIVSVPFQFNWMNTEGQEGDLRRVLNVQPVVPFSLSRGWSVIERVVVPLMSQPDGASGMGDITASTFVAPKVGHHGLIWGAGPVVTMPTATDPTLGSGQWAAGPTMVVMTQHGPWTVATLWNQQWSMAGRGTASRAEVSKMSIQPAVSYVTHSGLTFRVLSETTANWNAARDADTWTVPVLGMVSKVVRVGVLPVSIQAGGGFYVVHPDGGPTWQLRSALTMILPKGRVR